MGSQVVQNRTAKCYDQGLKFDSKEPSGMIIGEVSMEQTVKSIQNPNAGPNSGAEGDPWKDLQKGWMEAEWSEMRPVLQWDLR